MPAMTRVANAPVNFGIYRATSAPIGPRELLTELAEAGYDGVDSGPIGYLGADDLRQAGMGLAGGWVDLRYGDADGFAADLPGLRAALEAFRSEEHTSELQSRGHLVCRLLLEKKKKKR